MHVTEPYRAGSVGMASSFGLAPFLRARWLRWSFWLLLVSLPLLLSASQPLTPEDLKLVQRAQETYGVRAGKRVTTWRTLVMQNRAAGLTDRQKLEKVNQFFNQMRFIDDIKLWRKKDYWATPLEFLGAAGGIVKTSVFQSTLPCWNWGCRMKKCGWSMSKHWITTSFIWWLLTMTRHPQSP